jgi:hypothetical protein
MPSQKEVFAAQKAAKELAKVAMETAKASAEKAAVTTAALLEENKRAKALIARRAAKSISTWKAHNMEIGRVVGESQVADEIHHKNS